jgi:hypothetical protein
LANAADCGNEEAGHDSGAAFPGRYDFGFRLGQAAAPATLTSEERESALKSFPTTRDTFLKSISGRSQKRWTFKPAPDRWSVAEVAEHIMVWESAIFGLVQKQTMTSPAAPAKRDPVKRKDEMILERVPLRSHKAQAPEVLRPHRAPVGDRSGVDESLRGQPRSNPGIHPHHQRRFERSFL